MDIMKDFLIFRYKISIRLNWGGPVFWALEKRRSHIYLPKTHPALFNVFGIHSDPSSFPPPKTKQLPAALLIFQTTIPIIDVETYCPPRLQNISAPTSG